MMYVFMRGDAGGGDVNALLNAQLAFTAIALLALVIDLSISAIKEGLGTSLRRIWKAIPGWAVLALLLTNLLVGIGELALYLRFRLGGSTVEWYEHTPLVCALTCSLLFCSLYARANPSAAEGSSSLRRW